ncbi:hypothetical protein LAZ67_9003255 [Cordylochernes scorpioides]|uniref:Reverse transcriptase domain-containing protein n=1 Tax=Cordylochernes scorpioides TaxID=51811 RepID=A0ABY6KX47_9ARAC|nr:hypothetical protein LAZ67_9003255 [Cordylochernes scorpioides]
MFDRITTTLAYADDLIITAKNKEDMDTLLDALSDQATKAGLKVKPQNCATLHLLCRGRRRVLPTPFKVEGAPVPAMTKDESYLHLGVPTGFIKSRSLNSALQDLETVVKKIDESLLTPWQKIDVIKTFMYPKLDFILRGAPIHKTKFGRIARLISLAKNNEVLYIPPSQGGAGLLPFRDRAELSKIAQAFKMLTSKDTNTENLAKIFLKRTINRNLGRSASGEDMADYLSGRLDQGFDRDGGDVASLWSEARNATRRLRSTLRARWTWDPDRLAIRSQGTPEPATPERGRCGALNETLPHVLQHCRVHSAAWKRRHEAVLERLRKALRIKGEVRIPETSQLILPPQARPSDHR